MRMTTAIEEATPWDHVLHIRLCHRPRPPRVQGPCSHRTDPPPPGSKGEVRLNVATPLGYQGEGERPLSHSPLEAPGNLFWGQLDVPMRPTSKLHFILTRYIFLWTTGKWMVGAQPHRGHSDNRISRKRSHGIELLDDRRTGWVLWSRSRAHTLPGGPRSTRLPQPLKISILQPFKIFYSFITCVFYYLHYHLYLLMHSISIS